MWAMIVDLLIILGCWWVCQETRGNRMVSLSLMQYLCSFTIYIYFPFVLLLGGIDDSKLYWLDTMEVYKQRVDNVFWYKYFPRQLWSGSSELLCVITVSSNSNNCLQTTFRFIEGDFDTYVSQIRRPQVWGGEPELLMASHVLQ